MTRTSPSAPTFQRAAGKVQGSNVTGPGIPSEQCAETE